jgi:TetR/AcrR family transcriptional regulator, transcriptional repressor of bet genes
MPKKPSKNSSKDLALYAQFLDFKPRKGDLRKLEILDAAIDCLGEEGIHRTTFESIGKKLGIGRAHVAYHYPDLENLFEAAIKFCISNVQNLTVDAVSATESDEEKPAAFINATFEWAQRYPNQTSVLLLLYYLASVDKRFKKLHDNVRKLGAQRIEAVIKKVVPKKTTTKPAAMAKAFQALLTGHLVDHFTTIPAQDLESLRRSTVAECYDLIGIPEPKS